MDRLTQWLSNGTCRVAALAAEHEEKHNTNELIDLLLDKLATYEDTGLSPQEITTRMADLHQIEQEKERAARVADMVDLASRAIGMNNKKKYKRHGKTWYRPYRNYYCAGRQGDPVWEEMVAKGYAQKSKGLSSVYYFMTRAGLDWLGEQTGVNIHDVED